MIASKDYRGQPIKCDRPKCGKSSLKADTHYSAAACPFCSTTQIHATGDAVPTVTSITKEENDDEYEDM